VDGGRTKQQFALGSDTGKPAAFSQPCIGAGRSRSANAEFVIYLKQ
jgi:hypothetical protein